MARKSLKSNKARTTEERREDKATQATKPWRIVGVAFCLGALAMAVAFVLTPLGAWCFTGYEFTAVLAAKGDDNPQTTAKNKRSRPPNPEELARLAQRRAAQNSRSRKAEKAKDPLAELRRIEAINAQNRRMMQQRAAPWRHRRPQPTVPRPHHPAIPHRNVADTRR